MKALLLTLLFFLFSFYSGSQSIKNVDFNYVNENIVIFYDLIDCENRNTYDIEIQFINDLGKIIRPRILSGDFNKVSCGKNKMITWDLFSEREHLEGNFKVALSIKRTLDHRGREIISKPDLRILSIEELQNKTRVKLNQNLKPGSIFYVNSRKGIELKNGDVIKNIGRIIIIKDDEFNGSVGDLYLNRKLSIQMTNHNYEEFLIQEKFTRFEVSIYNNLTFFSVGDGNISIGLNIDYWTFNNLILTGIDVGYNYLTYFDLTLRLGVTPYLLNNNTFCFGLELQPIQIKEYYRYGSRYGVFGTINYKRFRVKPSMGIFQLTEPHPSFKSSGTYLSVSINYVLVKY